MIQNWESHGINKSEEKVSNSSKSKDAQVVGTFSLNTNR